MKNLYKSVFVLILMGATMIHASDLKCVLSGVKVPAKSSVLVEKCLMDDLIVSRDPDISLLGKLAPAKVAGTINVYEVTKLEGMTYGELAAVFAKKQKTTSTHLEQIQDLVKRTEAEEKTGILTNGVNFFFVQGENRKTFGLRLLKSEDGWVVYNDKINVEKYVPDDKFRIFIFDPVK